MRKHSKKAHAAAVYQPSDFVSVVAIGITAIVLVLSLFAMERFAGVPVSVRGESASAPSDATLSRTRRSKTTKPSQTAKRAAARKSHVPASSSSVPAMVELPTCANALCSNLLNTFLAGNPDCMKIQQCVDVVSKAIAEPDCMQDSTCYNLHITYSFYYLNQYCIQNSSPGCRKSINDLLEPHRKKAGSQGS